MSEDNEVIVGLDIGTTKIAAVVGEVTDKGLVIHGVGTAPSTGLRKGVVVNVEHTVASIREAIREAENMSSVSIRTVYVGIAGGHIHGESSMGMVRVWDDEITENDVARVIEAGQAIRVPPDREIIHVLAQDYLVDGLDGVPDPVGMSGARLEARVYMVTAAAASADNIVKCCNRSGLDVADIVLEPLASSMAVLGEDEKEVGVALVDIGGGTTDIAVHVGKAVVHTSVLTIGGYHITHDVSVGLRTSERAAEKIKIESGSASVDLVRDDEVVQVPGIGGRPPREVSRKELAGIIEPRVEEMFMLVAHRIEEAGYSDLLGGGVVLTGGSAAMPGMVEVAERVFDMPVRVGIPQDIEGLTAVVQDPKFATGIGLVKYGMENSREVRFRSLHAGEGFYSKVVTRMREWWHEVF